MADQSLSFGPFQLFPARAVLLRDGASVRLSSRALAILSALAERGGDIVSNAELMARAWPGAVVDDTTLRVHLLALRKVLRHGEVGEAGGAGVCIANVSGRGYRLLMPVSRQPADSACAQPAPPFPPAPLRPPRPITRLIGREPAVGAVARELSRRRLVTVVGGGGVGKTSVALAAAQRLAGHFADGAGFVDLSALAPAAPLADALAATLGLDTPGGAAGPALFDYLDHKHMLILLDNCEHVVAEAATLAEALLMRCGGVRLLTTSREPLGAEGEWLYRLAPLDVPPPDARAVQAYPAAQLFLERAGAAFGYTLDDADAPALASVCRQLDGLPLALELAATRLDLFDLPGLAAQLGDSLALLTRGRRTAQARHRTLRATLDWSYDLLPEEERVLLRRLGVFGTPFSAAAAVAVAGAAPLDEAAVLAGLQNLAAKSLLQLSCADGGIAYRLPGVTRAYAYERLAASGDGGDSQRRYLAYG